MSAHQEHLAKLVVQGAAGRSFLLLDEHLRGQIRRLLHAALDLLQMRVLLPEFFRDAIAFRHVHGAGPFIVPALGGQGVFCKEPDLAVRGMDQPLSALVFPGLLQIRPELPRIRQTLACQLAA